MTGNKAELSAAELWLRNTASVLESSRSLANVKVDAIPLPSGQVAPPTVALAPPSVSLAPPAGSRVINPFLVAFDRSTTVFQTHI